MNIVDKIKYYFGNAKDTSALVKENTSPSVRGLGLATVALYFACLASSCVSNRQAVQPNVHHERLVASYPMQIDPPSGKTINVREYLLAWTEEDGQVDKIKVKIDTIINGTPVKGEKTFTDYHYGLCSNDKSNYFGWTFSTSSYMYEESSGLSVYDGYSGYGEVDPYTTYGLDAVVADTVIYWNSSDPKELCEENPGFACIDVSGYLTDLAAQGSTGARNLITELKTEYNGLRRDVINYQKAHFQIANPAKGSGLPYTPPKRTVFHRPQVR